VFITSSERIGRLTAYVLTDWNTQPVDICQLSPDSFKTLSAVSVSSDHRTTSCFYRLRCTVFYPKLLFFVCCTAFSIYPLIHSWCDIARNRVGTGIGRWRWITVVSASDSFSRFLALYKFVCIYACMLVFVPVNVHSDEKHTDCMGEWRVTRLTGRVLNARFMSEFICWHDVTIAATGCQATAAAAAACIQRDGVINTAAINRLIFICRPHNIMDKY